MDNELIREKLTNFIEYSEGEKIRKTLHEDAKRNYKPKYQERYIEFMNDNVCSFSVNHAQSANFPYYFTLFTIKSQHVMGDSVEECLDKAMES